MSKIIVDCETGETSEIELSKLDKDQQKIDQTKFNEEMAEIQARAEARQAILDRLGLTADEAKLLLG